MVEKRKTSHKEEAVEPKKVIAISGASSGIGKAAAIHFAKQGYRVAICARRKDLLDEIARSVKNAEIFPQQADMTKWDDVQNFIQKTHREFEKIDVLFNNLGAGVRFTDFEDLSLEEIREGIEVNLTSVLYGCKAVIPIMKSQGRGHIINTTSILGKRARAGLSVYTAGKHGVDGFSRSLFNEVKKYGIKVSVLGPAMVNTRWGEKAGIKTPSLKGKMLEPEDVAHILQMLVQTPDHYTVWSIDLMALSQTIDPL